MQTLYERKIDMSIIIPIYNLEQFLNPMLDSLKKQDFADYNVEIIFVLNNCTDNSEEVIIQSGLHCTIITCSIQGCGSARNAAMDIAKGEYIWFMDGDDWLLSKTAVKDIIYAMRENNLDIIRIPYESNGFPWIYFSMVWQYAFRRDFINEYRFPNYQPHEDVAFMDCVLNKAGYNRETFMNLPYFNNPLYYYNYLREGSNMYRVRLLNENI